ncbi:MAG TPA: HEAT repeat domain-containing protein [Acidimicrobiales bacterium]|nr:HEAT repeat domain-containing protein [Acidimicrobiales bacterium]
MHAAGQETARKRRAAALAGHKGDRATALSYFDDPDEAVRATALGALARLGGVTASLAARALADPSPAVRRRAAELAVDMAGADFKPLLEDDDAAVVEAACFALGEVRDAGAVARLAEVAAEHADPLCRESAVAALGAIGDRSALPAILAALKDKPAVRRRAVIALAPFEGDQVRAALTRALDDRDWQVRQAAEDLLG